MLKILSNQRTILMLGESQVIVQLVSFKVFWQDDVEVEVMLQDDDRTLKVFIHVK